MEGVLSKGVLFGNGVCLEGVMYGGGFVRGGFVRGGFARGGFVRRGFCPRTPCNVAAGGRCFSFQMPALHRGCLLGCAHRQCGGRGPASGVCAV